MERYYILNSEKYQGWYCGKCGKKMMQDQYNIQKHAANCWPDTQREVECIDEGRSLVYRLEKEPGKLVLTVDVPYLKLLPGFTDRFRGCRWVNVFKAEYPVGSKEPRVVCDDLGKGLREILKQVRDGKIRPASGDSENAHSVFPGVLAVYDMRMFDHIYRTKGYRFIQAIPPEVEERLLKPLPGDMAEEKKSDDKNATKSVTVPLQATAYRYRGKTAVLRLVAGTGRTQVIFLFSRKYVACSNRDLVPGLLELSCRLTEGSAKAVRAFDKIYPEFLLRQYMKRSDNILVPLLAADYHCGMELAAKAGAAGVAENSTILKAFDRPPARYGNLKNLFGLPPAVLRGVDRIHATNEILERMKQVYEYNPEFLHFDHFSPSMIRFMLDSDITHCGYGNMPEAVENLTDIQILRALRYLEGEPEGGFFYSDYLNGCHLVGELVFGLTPDIPLREAHNRVVHRIRNFEDIKMRGEFKSRVMGSSYLELTTCRDPEDEETFADDEFMVIAPREPDDLFKESANMHNCVRIYTDAVIKGRSSIYFLRKKADPEKSYGTIEVTGDEPDRKLIQAKAFANERLGEEAQRFVAKWCLVKRIRIVTSDISKRS